MGTGIGTFTPIMPSPPARDTAAASAPPAAPPIGAFTIGAGQRAGLQGSASYAGAPVAGRVMGGSGIARVSASAMRISLSSRTWYMRMPR